MVKYDLRQQGFSAVEKIPKQSIINLIWAFITIAMTAVTFGSAIFFEMAADNKFVDFFANAAVYICENMFKFSTFTMKFQSVMYMYVLYFVIWLAIGYMLYQMFKNDLRGKKNSAAMRVILAVLSAAAVFAFLVLVGYGVSYVRSGDINPLESGFDLIVSTPGDAWPLVYLMITFIAALLLYMAVKLIMTIWVCSDRKNSAKLKVIGKGMPVCSCKEALKLRHSVMIYIIPFAFVYSIMYTQVLMSYSSESGRLFMMIVFFMLFFMSFDLTAVVYILFFQKKEKFDYISLDHHIYSVTFFKKSYLRTGAAAAQKYREVPEVEDTHRKEVFAHITTCLNPECENYGVELEKSPKKCPICGSRKYIADILANVSTCLNEDCENHGQELKGEIEKCSLCGGKTGSLAFRYETALKMPAIILSVISAVFFSYAYWSNNTGSLGGIVDSIRNVVFITSIILAFFSKSKAAVITAVLSILCYIGVILFIVG